MARRRPHEEEDDYPDDDDDDTRTTMLDAARVAARVRGSVHKDDNYEQYIATKYPSVPKTGADIKPGDTYVRIEPLAKKDTRAEAPRADGYDPRKPRERRYGPTWRANYDERQEALQRHPYYRSLNLIAGFANQPINRLITVDSMIARQAGERARQRTAELQAKIAENKIENLQKRLQELKNLETEQVRGLGRVAALERITARKEKLTEDQEASQAQVSSLEKVIAKYEYLHHIFKQWVSEVYLRDEAQRDQLQERFMALFITRASTADQDFLRDFLYGVELSGALTIDYSVTSKNIFLHQRPDETGSGGASLTGPERMVEGDDIGFIMDEWMKWTQQAPGLIDLPSFIANRALLPMFSPDLIKSLLEPSTIRAQIDETSDAINEISSMAKDLPFDKRDLESRRAILIAELDRLNARKDELAKTPLTLPSTVVDLLRQVEMRLQDYKLLSLEKIGVSRFFRAFGEQLSMGASPFLQQAIALDRQKQRALQDQITERQTALDALEKEMIEGEERTQTIKALEDLIDKATAEVDDAIQELNELGVSQYTDTFAHQNQPWVSGILDIESQVSAALSQALEIVHQSTGNRELTLHQLMSEERWLTGFAQLTGAILQRNAMGSGSSYAQMEILHRKDVEIEAIRRNYFVPQGGLNSLMDSFAQSQAIRSTLGVGSISMSVGMESMREDYGRRLQGFNPVSSWNTQLPAIRERRK